MPMSWDGVLLLHLATGGLLGRRGGRVWLRRLDGRGLCRRLVPHSWFWLLFARSWLQAVVWTDMFWCLG